MPSLQSEKTAHRRRGLTTIDGAIALIVLLLIVQMWLLTATLEGFLAGTGLDLTPFCNPHH